MTIIQMQHSHIAAIAALERLCFSDPWSEASIASELDNPLSLWLVAEESGAVIGYIGSQSVLDEADLMNLAVHPDHRRKGIAAALLTKLEQRLAKNGVETVALEVRASNDAAIRLYTQFGYSQAGLRKNYYFHPREDALILKKRVLREQEKSEP